MWKKVFLALWVLVVLGTVLCVHGSEIGEKYEERINCEHVEKILEIANSYDLEEEEGLVISKHIAGNNGPRDFAVINQNDILVLQTSRLGLQRYENNQYQKTYVFQETDNYEFVETDGVYAYVIGWEKLLRVDLSTGKEESFPYPPAMSMHVPKAVWVNGCLVLQVESCGNYVFNDKTGSIEKTALGFTNEWKVSSSDTSVLVKYADSSWKLDTTNIINVPVAVDGSRNLIVYVTNEKRKDAEDHISIQTITPTGQLQAKVNIAKSNHFFTPLEPVKMQKDGTLYLMCVYEPYTAIYALPATDCTVSEPDIPVPARVEIPLTERYDCGKKKQKQGVKGNRSLSYDIMPIPTGRTRQTVYNDAVTMKTLQWTLQSHNMNWEYVDEDDNQSTPAVYSRPAYLKYKTAGSTITGIPYAWNKMNGIVYDNAHGLYKFIDCVGQSQNVTGNVASKDISTPTIGLDCSAYVSSAYGLTNKVSSGCFYSDPLANTYYPAISQWNYLQSMDMVVKNGHVLLFKEWNQFGVSFWTMECMAANDGTLEDGKVLSRLVYVSDLQSNGYIIRRPSSWPCTHPRSDYFNYIDYSVYNHKKVCLMCGTQWFQPHTTYNGGPCTLCGRVNCASPNCNHEEDEK